MTHIIIGGGIMGLLTAHYLTADGEKVTLVEQGKLGRESSWAGGGILSPLYPWRYPDALNQLAAWSQQRYPDLVHQLKLESGIDAEWIQCGFMILDADEIDPAIHWAQTHNINLSRVNRDQINQQVSGIQQTMIVDDAIWMPEIAQVRNPRLLKALIGSLQRKGVELLEETPVTDLCIENDSISGVNSGDKFIPGSTVTVACGAWSARVLQNWLPTLNVEPVRGQMLLYKARPDTLNTMLLKDSNYLIPRKDGRIIVGSTLEFVGFQKETTEQARTSLSEFAVNLLPALKDFPIEQHWAGLRPGNSVQIPFISQHPDIKGLFVNTGHYRNGVVTAPASAMLCADLILSRVPILDTSAYKI